MPATNNVRTMSSVSQLNGNSNSSSNGSSLTSKRSLDVDRNSSESGSHSLSHLTSQQQIPTNNSHSIYSSQDHHDSYHHHHHPNALNGVVGDNIDQRNSTSMGHNSNRNNGGQQNHRNPDIMRKPIK
jgi:hypothetical protein